MADAVFGPDDARQVLATDAARYDKDVPALEEFRRFVGDGLLTSDGDRWRRDRRIVAPLFTRTRRRLAATRRPPPVPAQAGRALRAR